MVWTSAVGVTVSGNSLTKTAATAWGNAGAVSTQQIASGDGYVEFTASETTTYRMLGLSNGNTDTSYQDIDFAIDLIANGQVAVFESGTQKAAAASTSPATSSASRRERARSSTHKNGTVFYTSTQTPTYPLLVDTSLYNSLATSLQPSSLGSRLPYPHRQRRLSSGPLQSASR